MVLVYLFCVFVCQTTPVRPDGIAPIPPSAHKSSPDPRTLPNLQLNVCPEAPPYIPPCTRLIESIKTPTTSPESCIIQETFDLTCAPKPFKTVSISAHLVDPILQTDLQIQSFSPNVAVPPQISAVPTINLSNLENCDFVKNVVPNDCAQKALPTIQRVPAYFVTSKEDCLRNSNIPITTLRLDNFPNNICKVKVGDSKPIFIDCSKQTNIYKSPVTLTPVNTIELPNLGNSDPKLQVMQSLIVEPNQPNQVNEFVLQTAPVKILQENPVVTMRSNDIPINEPCKNIFPAIEPTNVETPASTDKILYPINNVKFNFGPNLFNSIQNACPEKLQPVIPSKLVPVDNNVGAVASPVPNIPITTQCDILPEYCYCNNINLLPKYEPINSLSPLFCKEELPLPITQLPNVNTITTIPIQSAIPSSLATKPIYETSPDSFTSGLSYSLNNIVSLLTTGLLSKVFGTSLEKAVPDIAPIEICDAITFKEPILDAIPSINIDIPYVSSLPLVTCSSPIETSPILPNPLIAIDLTESDCKCNAKITSSLCTEKPKRKPYIASVTINITPNTDNSNDIIIVV